MIRPFFLCISFLLLFTACKKAEPRSIEKKLITEKVHQLYHQYGLSNEAVYNQPISDDLFSPELKKALVTAIHTSKADIEKVKNSDHPDEKPLLFEGAIFSTLYEGYSRYTIQSINLESNTADVIINFEYSDAAVSENNTPIPSSKITWKDRIHFVNLDNTGWKIDNIIFDKKIAHSRDLRATLADFIQYAKQ